jgi:hypothetical protein
MSTSGNQPLDPNGNPVLNARPQDLNMTVNWLFQLRNIHEPQVQRLRWLVLLYAVLGLVVAFFLGIFLVIGIVLRVRGV